MGGLIQLLGIERSTDAQGNAGADKDVVRNGGDTAVVDLALYGSQYTLLDVPDCCPGKRWEDYPQTLTKDRGSILYLAATSRPTVVEVLEFQLALAPASTRVLTLW